MNFADNLQLLCQQKSISYNSLADKLGIAKSAISRWANNKGTPNYQSLIAIADFFGVTTDYLLGRELKEPGITEDYITFPVLYDVAAGFDKMAQSIDDWEGETLDVPRSYIHGKPGDYAVIRVKGDSMFPDYHDGDKVLLKQQPTLDYSGQVGVLIYEDCATLKRVDFAKGEDWLIMRPINPNYPPQKIVGVDLEQCRVVGVPKLLVRAIKD